MFLGALVCIDNGHVFLYMFRFGGGGILGWGEGDGLEPPFFPRVVTDLDVDDLVLPDPCDPPEGAFL